MKKSNFVALILSIIGIIFFGLGMSMCLSPELNMYKQGIVVGILGIIILLAMILIYRKMENKPPLRPSPKTLISVLLAIIGAIVFGIGLCLIMLFSKLILGVIIGIIGIIILICLIPLQKGIIN